MSSLFALPALRCVPRTAPATLLGAAVLSGAIALAFASPPAHAQLAAGEPANTYNATTYLNNAANVTDVAFLPDGRAVATLKGGQILVRGTNGTWDRDAQRLVQGSANLGVVSHNEQGLLGVAANGLDLYFFASVGANTTSRHHVLKATIGSGNNTLTWAPQPIVSMNLHGPRNHNGGTVAIHNNQLYVSVGDTGGNSTPPRNKFSSCLNKASGKILRVNLDGSVPNDNPLVGMAQVTACDGNLVFDTNQRTFTDFMTAAPDTRIYAWGMRNPFRIWVDPMTGLLWIGDVGETTREEISVGTKGDHFGYPFHEGTTSWVNMGQQSGWTVKDCDQMQPARTCKPPVFDYANEGGNGANNCVIGGPIPDGCAVPAAFASRYFFGDNARGNVWTLDVQSRQTGTVAANSRRVFGTFPGLSAIRSDAAGNLYMVQHGQNSITQIASRSTPANCTNAPPDAGAPADAAGGGGAGGGGSGGSGTGGGAGGGGAGGQAGGATGGAGDSGGGSTGTGGDGVGGDGNGTTSDAGSGCGCRVGGAGEEASVPALVVMLLGLGVALHRQRKRHET